MRLFYLIWLIICINDNNVFAQQKLGNETVKILKLYKKDFKLKKK
jgi:hypothetical protein